MAPLSIINDLAKDQKSQLPERSALGTLYNLVLMLWKTQGRVRNLFANYFCFHINNSCDLLVTHGCIVATVKLYLPDGKEAKAR